jgi:DNA-binding MarR family transcriptional regulator
MRDNKSIAYDQRVLDALAHGSLTLTDLARAMGYRGISKKLRDRVDRLVQEGRLERVPSADGRGVLIRRAKA